VGDVDRVRAEPFVLELLPMLTHATELQGVGQGAEAELVVAAAEIHPSSSGSAAFSPASWPAVSRARSIEADRSS
jgi:hypothetical protein